MNYRHAYHAGNFADVVKHVAMALAIAHMKRKPAPFRVIDTHAGAGSYDLEDAGEKTGEWRDGVGRLLAADIPEGVASVLEPYLSAVRSLNPSGLRCYPGSPVLASALLRPEDALTVNELHDGERERLRRTMGGRATVLGLDGWTAIRALLPPKERRGIVLIDPPFERPGEYDRAARGLAEGLRRFATGVYVVWYPIKDASAVARFHRDISALGFEDVLCAELWTARPEPIGPLRGCGLAIANPPHRMPELLGIVTPFLARLFAVDEAAGHRLVWLKGAKTTAPDADTKPYENRLRTRSRDGDHGRADMRLTGTVKFFNEEKGFGFIKPDGGGADVFVHASAVERAGLAMFQDGARVSFETEPDKRGKGPKAVNLRLESD